MQCQDKSRYKSTFPKHLSICTHEDADNDDDDEICDDDDDVATVESSVLMKLIFGFEIVVRRAFVAHGCLKRGVIHRNKIARIKCV